MTTAVGILSWKAHETLSKTLTSYEAGNLRTHFDAARIWFNARTPEDDALAARFGWDAAGDERNLGICGGMRALAENLPGEIVLLLQNDCPLCVPSDEAAAYLRAAQHLIATDKADIVRCRHRWNVGEGFSDPAKYKKFYPAEGADDTPQLKLRRLLRPFKATRMIGRAPYVLENPELRHPRYIRREGDFLIVDSAVINFTDQPFLMRRDLLLKLFDRAAAHPSKRGLNGMPVLEMSLNCAWWRHQHFRIAVGTGCFTHNRFDDSFRPDHRAFNAAISASDGPSLK